MSPLKVVLFLVILSTPLAWGQRKKKPPPQNPIDTIQNVANFDINKFAGKWYLLSVASECNYLKINNHRVEATLIQASASKTSQGAEILSVSTFRELDGICWEIKHAYQTNKIKGRFTIKGVTSYEWTGPHTSSIPDLTASGDLVYHPTPFYCGVYGKGYMGQVDVVLGETDYQNYAILYYQRRNKITLKLYGRKTKVTDDIYRKFDDHVKKQGIDLEYIYPFPAYGFCEQADQFHILNEVPR